MKNMKLTTWMKNNLLPMDMEAHKYTVGQSLTEEQAKEIVRIIAHSVDFELDDPGAKEKLCLIGSPYRDFVVCMTMLMLAGSFNPKWEETLWGMLDDDVQTASHTILFAKIMAVHSRYH